MCATDRYGKRTIILLLAFGLQTLAFIIWLVLPNCQTQCIGPVIFPIILQGLFLMMLSGTVFASVPLIVQQQYVGTAFGIIQTVKGILQAVLPLTVGIISDNLGDEAIVIEFIIISGIGLIFCLILYIRDNKGQKILLNFQKNNKIQLNVNNANNNEQVNIYETINKDQNISLQQQEQQLQENN